MKTTETAKHTLEPWYCHYEEGYGFVIMGGEPGTMDYGKIADVMVRGGGESEANAHLIASAPELLEALKDVVDSMSHAAKHNCRNELSYNLILGILPKIKKAISKTEGNQ